ncbi:ABC transporter substrate-binding protein [Muricoccus pecuniae]|uniref:Peptide/nickel transport system substrate-binding protein n=1 Tax=Muricoccus pecuniae TaxID=693023 RepID=A0A840YLY0_9PROT|nr:ABC transporter substrate-binding protein [Roseomonas pecuniae]MBB5695474.1 peptide/nickel transport system substrate-binding protein [Roseomonas pecuniae]
MFLAGLLLLVGFGAADAQTLRVGLRDDPDILDPTLSRTYVGTVVMTAICDKLFDFDEKLNIVPVLATGYEWQDEKTLIIRLRQGITFHDGTPLDAEAVKYTLERHLNLSGSYRRSEIGAMERAEVMDPLTVRVLMRRPFAPFIAVLTDRAGMLVSPRAAEAAGRDFGRHPVCAGPFRFVERVAQDRVVVERFPSYWDAGRIHYGRVQYSIMPNSTARLANLQSGTLDVAEVAPLDAEAVAKDRRLSLVSVPSLGYGALTVNLGDFPQARGPMGRDARVRQAFSLSLDRKALSEVVFAGLYEPAAQPTSPASPLHVPSIVPPQRDVARARTLLREAGVTTPLRVALTVYNTPQGVQTGEVIQAMAAEAGFEVEVKALEFGAALSAVNNGDYVVTLGGWSGLLDTDSNSWSFLHTGAALNMARYSNAEVDSALDRAREEAGMAARRMAYEGAWRKVSEDLPLIYLWQPRNVAGVSRRVSGFRLLADGLYRLQDVRPAP